MLNGWYKGRRTGSGTIKWHAKKELSKGGISAAEYAEIIASSAPSPGYCNNMGTATTMNSLTEALGMSLPGSAAIPAVHKERAQMAYLTGKRIVDLVWQDVKPGDIITRQAFENAIVVNSAIGGSTNAPIHLKAVANHLGVPLVNQDWEDLGWDVPLLLDLQPAGRFLGEDFHHAGGVPSIVHELIEAGRLPHPDAPTVNGLTLGENCAGKETLDREVIRPFDRPILEKAGFLNLKGNLFDTAIMKTSVISDEFRDRYLSNPDDPNAFEGPAVVFDGREDYHARINDPSLDTGTSGSPSILNASPEAAVGGGLALIETGDRVRIDLNTREANILVPDDVLQRRRKAVAAKLAGGGLDYVPAHQTPWQEIQRGMVAQFDQGMVLEPATKYREVIKIVPRDNH